MVAFLHIPKCAGSSVASGLVEALKPARIFQGYDRSLFGAFDDFQTFDKNVKVYEDISKIDGNADLVLGHLSLSTIRTAFPRHQVFTIVREARSRLLSHWLFWRSRPADALARWGTWSPQMMLSHCPLCEFLTTPSLACQTDNLVLRMLLWPHPLIPVAGFIDPSDDHVLVAEARRALASLWFVGAHEDSGLGEFIGRSIKGFVLPWTNEATVPQFPVRVAEELSPATMEALDLRTRLDSCLLKNVKANESDRIFKRNLARYKVSRVIL